MENMTFKQLLTKYEIEIPTIQRDYAQGREGAKIERIRTEFLKDIKSVHTDNKPLHLDFVYGFIKEHKFIPLDGQQRLTTLFLLHWYFQLKEQKEMPLTRFGYNTHEKPKEFIKFLCDKPEVAIDQNTLSSEIQDCGMFRSEWQQEPTIKGMLVMLDAIHDTFKDVKSGDFLDNITFSFFNMGENHLTDDLYIKMNSRGKPLSDFDTFKAKFERVLENFPELSKEFEEKIDGVWIDLFWQYREDEQFTIDQPFLRMFWVLTEILFFKFIGAEDDQNPFFDTWKGNIPILKYELIEQVYKTQKHAQDAIKLLFSWLDLCKNLGKEKINDEFNRLFCEEKQSEKYDTHLSIYDTQVNLFSYVCSEGYMTQRWLLLFYTVLQSQLKCDIDSIRIIRNLVIADKMRAPDFQKRIPFIDYILNHKTIPQDTGSGFNTDLLREERFKLDILQKSPKLKEVLWKLENNRYLQGVVHLFNPYLEKRDIEKIKKIEEAFWIYFNDINDEVRDLFRRALLTKGDYAIRDGKNNNGGSWYMGVWEDRYHLCKSSTEWQQYFTSFKKAITEKHQVAQALLEDIIGLTKEDANKKLEELTVNFKDKNSCYYKMIKNDGVLNYSKQKRFMWDDEGKKISNILVNKDYRNEKFKAYEKF